MTRFTIAAYVDAIQRKDEGAILDMLADDVEVVDVATGIVVRGKPAVQASLERSLRALDRIAVEERVHLEQDGTMALLLDVRGRYGDDVPDEPGWTKVAGKDFALPVAVFLRVDEEGRLRHATRVLDLVGVLRQLGLEEDDLPAMVPTPVATPRS